MHLLLDTILLANCLHLFQDRAMYCSMMQVTLCTVWNTGDMLLMQVTLCTVWNTGARDMLLMQVTLCMVWNTGDMLLMQVTLYTVWNTGDMLLMQTAAAYEAPSLDSSKAIN